jgi:hypothetical protein
MHDANLRIVWTGGPQRFSALTVAFPYLTFRCRFGLFGASEGARPSCRVVH